MEQPRQSGKAGSQGSAQPPRKFVDLGSDAPRPSGSKTSNPARRTDRTLLDKLAAYDNEDLEDPYLKELMEVLDRVENEGEPYLEKLILQAGLELSSPSETDMDEKKKLGSRGLRLAKSRSGEKDKLKKLGAKGKAQETKMGIIQPASEDDYRDLYGSYKDTGGTMSSGESLADSSTTSTESLAESLAAMIAKGEAPVPKTDDNDEETYGSKIVPYGSFAGAEFDAGLAKPTKSDAFLRTSGLSPNFPVEPEPADQPKPDDFVCADESSSVSGHSERYSEDLYDEGKEGQVGDEARPEMVLLSSSEDDDDLGAPQHYYEYNQKESQCLAIVGNFRRQFTDAYPHRKPLFLTPVNEVGVPRFVCTTIRPTIFSYSDLFHWDGIARFLSYQMEYILLNPPDVPPSVVMSPSFILKERQGNCFDYCFLLASVLIGVGYDAYIVHGYAKAAICTGDESHRVNPCFPQDVIPQEMPQYEKDFDFADMQSQVAGEVFRETVDRHRKRQIDQRNASIKGLAELLEKEKVRAGPQRDEDEELNPEMDPYEGRRVHAWIVVLPGKRDITDPFFIDPLTGTAFPASHDEFLAIETIFNHRQFYVNMQPTPEAGEAISWDVGDVQKWEPVFKESLIGNGEKEAGERAESEDFISSDGCRLWGKDLEGAGSNCQRPGWPFRGFEMPRPWSEPLTISKKRYLRFCKNGYRLHRYHKCDMEYYHHYERKDGLINKFILFSNKRKTHITEVKEVYENRRDRLKYRKHLTRLGILREYYAPGHGKALRMHQVEITGEKPAKFSDLYRALNTYLVGDSVVRTIHYYFEYRNDGLETLTQKPEEITWSYRNRKDRLLERYMKYGGQIERSYAVEALKCKGDQRPVAVIREKFARNKEIANPDLDIYIREYAVKANRLFLIYQPADGLIASTQRRFVLPDFNETPQTGAELASGYLRMNEDVMLAIFRDQLQEEERLPLDIWDEMVSNYKASLSAIISARQSEDEFKETISLRTEEEQEPALWHSAWDVERHPRAAGILRKTEQKTATQKLETENGEPVLRPEKFDWVAPYMAAYGDKEVASMEDALAIRQAVLDDVKERLLYTANTLQKAHEEEFHKLQTLNEKFRKAQVSGEVTPHDYLGYENEKTSVQFKMHMLERRQELLQFEGPAKLKRLNDWILRDKRFAGWLKGMHLDGRENVMGDSGGQRGKKKGKKKEWKVDSDEGEIVLDPIEEESYHGRGDGYSSSMATSRIAPS